MAIEIYLRRANITDMKRVFCLSNDPVVRESSMCQNTITWEQHKKWFAEKINDVNCYFYIVEDKNGNFVAQVRIDCQDNNIISVSVAEQYRGKELAWKIIKLASLKCAKHTIIAYVKKTNEKSYRSFIHAGYLLSHEKVINDESYYVLKFVIPVFIIAEMSANHCGDMGLAKKIILKAKDCGADAVKIQTYTADTLTIDCHNDCFKIKGGTLWDDRYLYDLYKEAYTPWEWQKELKLFADNAGIMLFSTPFDKTAVDFLETIECPIYKIASFEAIDTNLVKYVASKHKPMIVSTGICSEAEIQDVVDACKSAGNNDLTLLKCTSAYPARIEDMNLLTIPDMIKKFGDQGVKVGLSDHSMNIETPVTAVALGATVIEKHFTLDRNLGGPDSGFSLNPDEFATMVKAVRNTEKLLGKPDYTVNEKNRIFARSLFVVKDIKKGEKLTEQNICSIRPGCGLHPKYLNQVMGKFAAKDLKYGKPLTFDDFE